MKNYIVKLSLLALAAGIVVASGRSKSHQLIIVLDPPRKRTADTRSTINKPPKNAKSDYDGPNNFFHRLVTESRTTGLNSGTQSSTVSQETNHFDTNEKLEEKEDSIQQVQVHDYLNTEVAENTEECKDLAVDGIQSIRFTDLWKDVTTNLYGHDDAFQHCFGPRNSQAPFVFGAQNCFHRNSLMFAAWEGNFEAVRLLLEPRGLMTSAIFEQKNENNQNALMIAAINGHPKVVQLLLEAGGFMTQDILFQQDNDKRNALMLAAKNGYTDVVQLFLEATISLMHHNEFRQPNTGERKELVLAAFDGDYNAFKRLRSIETKIYQKDIFQKNALMLAAENGHWEVVQLLLGESGLMTKDVPLQKDKGGSNALMLAAKNGHFKVVELLLRDNSRITQGVIAQQDKGGSNALMLAAKKGHSELVQLILGESKLMTQDLFLQQDKDGSNALMLAAKKGHFEVVQLLLGDEELMTSDVLGHVDILGKNALLLAVEKGHFKVVPHLLEADQALTKSVLFGKLRNDGWNALMLAAWLGHFKIVNQLLHSSLMSMEIFNQKKDGKNALQMAIERSNAGIVRMLQAWEKKALRI